MGKNGGRLLCQINLEVLIKFYFCHVKSPPHLKMQFLFRGSLVFLINPGYQAHDTIRWKDVIFENNQMGSITTKDTLFRKRYGRGYFIFSVDTLQPIINFKKTGQDEGFILSLHYQRPDSNTIQLWGKQRNDSIFIELKRSTRHFQLAEKQFHWLSEANQ